MSSSYPPNSGDQPEDQDLSQSDQRRQQDPTPDENYPPQERYPQQDFTEQGYGGVAGDPRQNYPGQDFSETSFPPQGYPSQGYPQPSYQQQPYTSTGPTGGGQPHPKGTPVLVLGILSIVFCGIGLILGPLAIVQGGRALKEIDAARGLYNNRQTVNLGRILGIIGTILSVLGVLWVIFVAALGIGGTTVNGY